jgi:alkylation response protein AidB-like acyl-CoA dehydrogenase
MSEMADMLAHSAGQLFAALSGPADVRRIEAGGSWDALWSEIESAGFADALVPEADGGAGLSGQEAAVLLFLAGAHALPLPLGQTMIARAAALRCGLALPEGPVAIAGHPASAADGVVVLADVPYGATCRHVLASIAGRFVLLPTKSARIERSGVHGSLTSTLSLPETTVAEAAADLDAAGVDWLAAGAVVTAARMVGAMERALAMTVDHANQRVQFGKPIGRLQAVQQQISVMVEEVFAARIAVSLALAQEPPHGIMAAVAKTRAGEAAAVAAAVAHAVHGAIGITEEFDLQLLTRQLHEGRVQFGGERYWNQRLGEAALAESTTPLEFVQAISADRRMADIV